MSDERASQRPLYSPFRTKQVARYNNRALRAPARQPDRNRRLEVLQGIREALKNDAPYLVLGPNARAPDEPDNAPIPGEFPLYWFSDDDLDEICEDLWRWCRHGHDYLDLGRAAVGDDSIIFLIVKRPQTEEETDADTDKVLANSSTLSDSVEKSSILDHLEALSLEHTLVTDAGARLLAKELVESPRLKQLTLFGCDDLSDAAVDAFCELLQSGRKFTTLTLSGPNISQEALARLKSLAR